MTLVRIDIAAHILPARYFGRLQQIPGFYLAKRVKGVRCLFDLTVRFQIMDAFGEYRQVLSLAAPPIDRLGPPEVTPDLARLANDELADLVAAHPDRFAGAFAGLPLNHADASLRELDRLSSHPGFVGVQIYSNVAGRPLAIHAGVRVCQIVLQRCEGSAVYTGRFARQEAL